MLRLAPRRVTPRLGLGTALRERAGGDVAQPELVGDAGDVRGIGDRRRERDRIPRRRRAPAQVHHHVDDRGRVGVPGRDLHRHVAAEVALPVPVGVPYDRLLVAVVRHGAPRENVQPPLRDVARDGLDVLHPDRDAVRQHVHRHVRRLALVGEFVVHRHPLRGAVLREADVRDGERLREVHRRRRERQRKGSSSQSRICFHRWTPSPSGT